MEPLQINKALYTLSEFTRKGIGLSRELSGKGAPPGVLAKCVGMMEIHGNVGFMAANQVAAIFLGGFCEATLPDPKVLLFSVEELDALLKTQTWQKPDLWTSAWTLIYDDEEPGKLACTGMDETFKPYYMERQEYVENFDEPVDFLTAYTLPEYREKFGLTTHHWANLRRFFERPWVPVRRMDRKDAQLWMDEVMVKGPSNVPMGKSLFIQREIIDYWNYLFSVWPGSYLEFEAESARPQRFLADNGNLVMVFMPLAMQQPFPGDESAKESEG